MDTTVCKGCNKKMIAEIKDLKSYNNHNIPVWYCLTCLLSTPVKKKNRHVWVELYKWDPPGFLYGHKEFGCTVCIACNKDSMYADATFLMSELFYPSEFKKPAWTCYTCGHSDKAMKTDGHTWADMFKDWR